MEAERESLVIERLSKTYFARKRGEVAAASEVSFSVSRGEVVALLGPNGAGKTTVIKSVCGIVVPDSGHVTFGGEDLTGRARQAVKYVAAVLEGNRNIYWELSPMENIEFFAGLQGIGGREAREEGTRLLRVLDLEGKRDTPVRKLSHGMKQKVAIACALARRTPVLLLDEPTLGLDVGIAIELRRYLRGLAMDGRAIVVSSHDMGLVERVADRVVVLNRGSVVVEQDLEGLVDLFEMQAYKISVSGGMSEEVGRAITSQVSGVSAEYTGEGGGAIFVRMGESAVLYSLFKCMEGFGLEIVGIDRTRPDLEDVFLQLVDEGEGG